MKKSVIKSAVPTSLIRVYFLIIRAMMSVPPDDARQLNIIALPAADKSIAKINSRKIESVSGSSSGISLNSCISAVYTKLQ